MASGGNTRKAPSAAVDKAGEWRPHGAKPAQRGRSGVRRENQAGETSGVWGNDRGYKSSGVAHKSPGVGDEEGCRKASGVA